MTNRKISEMTVATSLADADFVPIVQGGVNKYIQSDNLRIFTSTYYETSAAETSAGVTPTDKTYKRGNVFRYGAVGDGVTDDYTAFNNAMLSSRHVVAPWTGSGYVIGTTIQPTVNRQKFDIFDDITYTGTAATGLFKVRNVSGMEVACYGLTKGNDDNYCVHFEWGTSNRFHFNHTQGFLIHFPFIQAVGGFAASHSLVENYISYNLMSGYNAANSASLASGQGVLFRNTTGDTTIPMEGLELRGGFIWRHAGHGIHIENNVDAKYLALYGAIDNASGGGQDYTVDSGSPQTSAVFYTKFIRQEASTFGDGDMFVNPRNGQIFINSESLVSAALNITCKTGVAQGATSAKIIAQVQGGTTGGTRYTSVLAGSKASLSTSDAANIQAYYDPGTTATPAASEAKLAGILASFRRNDDASAIEGGNAEFQKRAGANTVDFVIKLMNAGTKSVKVTFPAEGGILGPIASEIVTTTNIITAAESGKTFFLNAAGGFTSTLPAPALGLKYTFIVKTAPTTAYIITTNAGANLLYGTFLDIVGELTYFSAQDTLNFVASTSVVGDRLEVESDGTNWYCKAFSGADGGITVAVT